MSKVIDLKLNAEDNNTGNPPALHISDSPALPTGVTMHGVRSTLIDSAKQLTNSEEKQERQRAITQTANF